MPVKSICVYCGSQPGTVPEFVEDAVQLGKLLAQEEIELVYGGGTSGIMGAVARSVVENGGKVTGIIPEFLLSVEGNADKQLPGIDTIVTASMHERKQRMFEQSEAFLTLPGGIGTLEEIIEMMTWAQLGRHEKPIAFLNTHGFWDPLFELLDHMNSSGFLHTANRIKPIIARSAEDAIEAIQEASG